MNRWVEFYLVSVVWFFVFLGVIFAVLMILGRVVIR